MAANNAPRTTQEIIKKCRIDICGELNQKQAETQALITECDGEAKLRQYKICQFKKAEVAYLYYRNLELSLIIPAAWEVTSLSTCLTEYKTKDTQLKDKLKELSTLLKDTKSKLSEMYDESCKLERCLEEEKRCNPDFCKALESTLPSKFGVKDMKELLAGIQDLAKTTYTSAKDAFDASVDVAGIQAFNDVDTLVPRGTDLQGKITVLKTTVENLVKVTETEWKTAKDALGESTRKYTEYRAKKCKSAADQEGLELLYDFLCKPGCENITKDSIKTICENCTTCLDLPGGELPPIKDCEADDCKDETPPPTDPPGKTYGQLRPLE